MIALAAALLLAAAPADEARLAGAKGDYAAALRLWTAAAKDATDAASRSHASHCEERAARRAQLARAAAVDPRAHASLAAALASERDCEPDPIGHAAAEALLALRGTPRGKAILAGASPLALEVRAGVPGPLGKAALGGATSALQAAGIAAKKGAEARIVLEVAPAKDGVRGEARLRLAGAPVTVKAEEKGPSPAGAASEVGRRLAQLALVELARGVP